jgi:hypothetical protein
MKEFSQLYNRFQVHFHLMNFLVLLLWWIVIYHDVILLIFLVDKTMVMDGSHLYMIIKVFDVWMIIMVYLSAENINLRKKLIEIIVVMLLNKNLCIMSINKKLTIGDMNSRILISLLIIWISKYENRFQFQLYFRFRFLHSYRSIIYQWVLEINNLAN